MPNLVVVLGCVDETWKSIGGVEGFKSFIDRVAVHGLDPLAADEAADLVARRVRSWEEFDPAKPAGWPFDLDSVRRFAGARPASPRGFLQACRAAFDEWQVSGRKELVTLGGATLPATLDELFVREWQAQLAASRQGLKAAHDYQEAELWEGVEEALKVARSSQPTPEGVAFEGYQLGALRSTASDARPSAELTLATEDSRVPVVVAVTKKDGGTAFGNWVNALDEALGGNVAGAVLVRPNRRLSVGKGTVAYKKYQARLTSGPVRLFPLDENEDSFAQLECLRQMVRKARAGDLSLGGQTIGQEQCRKLVAQTHLLKNLKLFDQLFHNWQAVGTAVEPATPTSSKAVLVTSTAKSARTQSASGQSPQPVTATISAAPPADDAGWADRTLATVVEKLRHKGQPVCPVGVEVGATFVRLKVALQDDADFAKVKKQADNLKLHLMLAQRPLIAAQAGFISIDIQRPDRQVLPLSQVLANCPDSLAERPAFPAGQDVAGKAHWLDLPEPGTCHLLVAGTTGSGKSEFLKAMLAGLALRLGPDQLQFALIDPKQVTFNLSGDSPYLRGEVAYDVADALPVVADCLREMTRRYTLLRQRGKEHIGQLAGSDAVPRWVVVFDEFADLMADKGAKKELETLLKRLGAMGRAAGIHLVLGTQRPEASVVTPLLRDNLPARVGLHMAGERGSKLILEEPDAAHLLGKGDLFLRQGGGLLRLQSPFVTKAEFEAALRCH